MLLPIRIGYQKNGEVVYKDLAEMPHLLVAGATGSGKSVFLNNVMHSLLTCPNKKHIAFVLIDPKKIEFSAYSSLGNLLCPIITEPKTAINILKQILKAMESRYEQFSKIGVKNIKEYNEVQKTPMGYVVIVIDEMADLMMVAGEEFENIITRLAQLARASGIHLVTATQRPSVNVVTGTIKANLPTRITFALPSRHDSITIINSPGAEKLKGKGDLLLLEMGQGLVNLQGAIVPDWMISELVKENKRRIFSISSVMGGGLSLVGNIGNIIVSLLLAMISWSIFILTIYLKVGRVLAYIIALLISPILADSRKKGG